MMSDLKADLIRLFATRYRIGVGHARVGDAGQSLWPEEERAVARATPARRAEFAAGRMAARQALRGIGLVPYAVPMAEDRAPVWPRGVLGSITHHGADCLAIVTRKQRLAGLGLDLEAGTDLPGDLWPEILTAPERDWLQDQDAAMRGHLARIIFSAKEASYKALYPVTGKLVGFEAISIRPDPEGGRFAARLETGFGAYRAGCVLHGAILRGPGHILTALALPSLVEHGENAAQIPDMEINCFPAETAQIMEI